MSKRQAEPQKALQPNKGGCAISARVTLTQQVRFVYKLKCELQVESSRERS